MKKLLLLLLLSTQLVFARKYAVIIAIGDYPAETGWASVSAANDIPLIKNALLDQKFEAQDILVLQNEEATRNNILKTLKELNERLQPGDILVVHYSGHGQQIFDDNADEADGLDEALVPYDARVAYSEDYQGQNHIRDDEIGIILTNLRNTLGSEGQLLMLLDSCHSGSSTRGGKARGSEAALVPENWQPDSKAVPAKGSDMFEKVQLGGQAAPFVLISGASAAELNYEYEGQGALSYAFAKAMNELGSDLTYRQLYSKIASIMNVISPRQTPTIEGDQDYKLFKGEYVKQQPYFEVTAVPRPNVIRIRGGNFQGIFDSTTVKVLPAGSLKATEEEVLSKGTVVLSKFNEATIKLEENLPTENSMDYWVFPEEKTYGNIAVKVFFEEELRNTEVAESISGLLDEKGLGEVVTDSLDSQLMLSLERGNYILSATNGRAEIGRIGASRGAAGLELLEQQLFSFAQGQYLKNLHLDDRNFEFSFRLLPVDYDELLETLDTLPEHSLRNAAGTFTVRPGQDQVVLEVTNHSDRELYFSIIEINSKGKIAPFMPNLNCQLSSEDRKIAAGQTVVFRDCIYNFGPPYEKLVLKGFASPTPLDFSPTVNTRGAGNVKNPLEQFIGQTYSTSRGNTAVRAGGRPEGFSTEFLYEIVEE